MFFGYFTLTARRFADGTFEKGRFTNGASTDFAFVTGIQQPTPDDLELLEEGKRTRQTVVLFTETQLRLATKTANADNILIDGQWFEANAYKPFKTLFPNNYRIICTKIEDIAEVPVPPEPEDP